MNSLINWFNGLSRNMRIAILVGVCLFTPIVSVVFTILIGGISAIFSIIGFIFSILNWKGVLFFLVVGMVFAAKLGYEWAMDEEENYLAEEEPFIW
jgi:hypothetical protein